MRYDKVIQALLHRQGNPLDYHPDISSGVRLLKQHAPNLYAMYFNKLFRNVEQYHDWRAPFYFGAIAEARKLGTPDGGMDAFSDEAGRFAWESLLLWLGGWVVHDNPVFFIKPDLLTACRLSAPPQDFDIDSLKLPYESQAFVLPKGFTVSGREVMFAGFAKFDLFRHGIFEAKERYVYVIISQFENSRDFVATRFTGKAIQRVLNAGSATELEGVLMSGDSRIIWEADKEGSEVHYVLLRMIVNVILAMDAVPQMLRPARREGRQKPKRKSDQPLEIWSPNIIGEKYVLPKPTGAEGSHASPRMHWRRGHFRRQGIGRAVRDCVCGHTGSLHHRTDRYCMKAGCDCEKLEYFALPRFSEYKTVWIQPVLVNAPKPLSNGSGKTDET